MELWQGIGTEDSQVLGLTTPYDHAARLNICYVISSILLPVFHFTYERHASFKIV
jgi:hypothetical protein